MRSKLLSILAVAALLIAPSAAFAEGGCSVSKDGHACKSSDCHHGHDCQKSGGCEKGCSKDGGCPILAKFAKKSAFMLENEAGIGLSAEQVQTIKALQLDVEKLKARQEADMKIGMLEIESKLSEDTIDTAAVGAMIDQGAAGWSAGAKASLEAYAKLKGVLSAEQLQKMKDIWKGKQSASAHKH